MRPYKGVSIQLIAIWPSVLLHVMPVTPTSADKACLSGWEPRLKQEQNVVFPGSQTCTLYTFTKNQVLMNVRIRTEMPAQFQMSWHYAWPICQAILQHEVLVTQISRNKQYLGWIFQHRTYYSGTLMDKKQSDKKLENVCNLHFPPLWFPFQGKKHFQGWTSQDWWTEALLKLYCLQHEGK